MERRAAGASLRAIGLEFGLTATSVKRIVDRLTAEQAEAKILRSTRTYPLFTEPHSRMMYDALQAIKHGGGASARLIVEWGEAVISANEALAAKQVASLALRGPQAKAETNDASI